MDYIVGYGRFEIFRNDSKKPFRIRERESKRELPGEFWNFAEARRECDAMRRS